MLTFPQFYAQELSAWKYRKALSRMALSHRQMALSQFRAKSFQKWESQLEQTIQDCEPVSLLVLDSWIKTVAKFHHETPETAEGAFGRKFRGVLDYRKSNPDYLTPLARKFHKENKYFVA